MYDWNDLRHFLAVARTGSTLAAARAMGVNQTTTSRRITALEEALHVRLFDRLQRGYALTEAGREFVPYAERVEAEALVLDRIAIQRQRSLSGVVRVRTNEAFANIVLVPCIGRFAQEHPEIRIEMALGDGPVDLAGGEADVALRGGARPDQPGIVSRKVGDVRWSIYCSRDYAREHGCPGSTAELDGHHLIGVDGVLAGLPGGVWLAAQAPTSVTPTRSNSLTNLLIATKAGLGLGPLPCILGDAEPDLVRCLPPVPELDSDLWLVTREALKDQAHVRTFNAFVAAHIASLRPQFAGVESPAEAPAE